ncbi:hypothetical protein C8F01DRAFT_1376582 [Mycena amicta]|nr:hypothetical protein C8F01DRAFT_1376582 [Mycena amicta]
MFSVRDFANGPPSVDSQPRRRYETQPPWPCTEPQKPHRRPAPVLCAACASQSGYPMAQYDYSRAGTCVACGRRFFSAAAAQGAGYASAMPVLVPGFNPQPYSSPSTPSYANHTPNHFLPPHHPYHWPAQTQHASYYHPYYSPASRIDAAVAVAPPGYSHRALHPAHESRLPPPPPASPWVSPFFGPSYPSPPLHQPSLQPHIITHPPASAIVKPPIVKPPKTPPRAVTPDWARTTPSPSPSPVSSPIADDTRRAPSPTLAPLRLPTAPPPRFAVAPPPSLAPPTSRAPALPTETRTNFRWPSIYRPRPLPPSSSPVNAAAAGTAGYHAQARPTALERVHRRIRTTSSPRMVNDSSGAQATAVRIPPPEAQVLGKRAFPFDFEPAARSDGRGQYIHSSNSRYSNPAAETATQTVGTSSRKNLKARFEMIMSAPPATRGTENRLPKKQGTPHAQNIKSGKGKAEVRRTAEGVEMHMHSRQRSGTRMCNGAARTMIDIEDSDSDSEMEREMDAVEIQTARSLV